MTLHRIGLVCLLVWAVVAPPAVCAQDADTSPCLPPCLPGLMCVDGTCVSACNPPCPIGYACDTSALDCVPLPPDPPAPATTEVCPEPVDQNGCREWELFVSRVCRKRRDVVDAGNVLFPMTMMAYGTGSLYLAVGGVIWSYDGAEYYDKHDRQTDTYEYIRGYDSDVLFGTIPQIWGTLGFGILNQIPKGKQRMSMRALGIRGAERLYVAGWICYLASVVSGAVTMAAFIGDNVDMAHVASIVNAAIMVPSVAVNVTGYYVQHGHLRRGVDKLQGNRQFGARFETAPYLAITRDGGLVGIAVRF